MIRSTRPHSILIPLFMGIVCASPSAQARPEYALKSKLTCVTCHALPTGGGPRTLMGKSYGSHGHAVAPTSASDLYYADLRLEAFYPTHRTAEQGNGLALMVAAVSANVPVTKSDDGSGLNALLTADFGVLSSGTREAVLNWRTPGTHGALVPDHVLLGRFYPAFGLLTDEHRTYTRVQTASSLRDYEMGTQLTWLPGGGVQCNLALTNGFQSGGTFTVRDLTYALISDLRWNPPSLPLLLGGSASYHRTVAREPSPYAYSLYSGLSIGRLTDDRLPLTWLGEIAVARYWNRSELNPRLGFFFNEGDALFLSKIAMAQSIGYYTELAYDLTHQFALTAKYDRIAFDANRASDAYSRFGAGFRWHLASNLTLHARYETAGVGRVDAKDSLSRAAQDDVLALLRLWL